MIQTLSSLCESSSRRSSSGGRSNSTNETVIDSSQFEYQGNSKGNLRNATEGRSLEPKLAAEVYMERIIDKLKLLNYEKDFCKRKKPHREQLHRTFFILPPGPSTRSQFTYFTSLAAWLLSVLGQNVAMPKEFDDPSVACTNLLTQLRTAGFSAPSFPITKLHRGFGLEVCSVLDSLIDLVIEQKQLQFKAPLFPADQYKDVVDDEEEEEEMPTVDMADEVQDFEEEEEEAYMAGVREEFRDTHNEHEKQDKEILASQVDAEQWRLEVERVSTKLKIPIGVESRDWRHHLEQAHEYSKLIAKIWVEGKEQLQKVQRDVGTSIEKLQAREYYLNDCCSNIAEDYKLKRQHLNQLQEDYNIRMELVSKQNNELHQIQEQLDELKQVLDERGSSLSDASPVVRIRGTLKNLNEEIKEMEVLIGLVSHSLLRLSMDDKGQGMSPMPEDSGFHRL